MTVAVAGAKPEPVRDRPSERAARDALAIRTDGLTKSFGPQVVVDHLDLAVPTGAVYGFLGPNGSGKTTTIRMVLGLVAPTSGSVTLLGESLPGAADALRRTGALVEGPAFHPYLSGTANLERLDAVDLSADPRTSADRIHTALDRVGLMAAAGKRFRQYSLGMKQRLAIAAALLAPRDLLVLDEPTNGLDPQGTREVRTLVAQLAADGATVLVSSHLLAEIEQMCTRVGVLERGRLVVQEQLDVLLRPTGLITVRTPDAFACASLLGDTVELVEGERLLIRASDPAALNAHLVGQGIRVAEIGPHRRDLEQVVLAAGATSGAAAGVGV